MLPLKGWSINDTAEVTTWLSPRYLGTAERLDYLGWWKRPVNSNRFSSSSVSLGTKNLENVPAGVLEFLAGNKKAVIVPAQRLRSKFGEPDMNGHKVGVLSDSNSFFGP